MFRYYNTFQSAATIECVVTNLTHTCRNFNSYKATVFKRIVTNTCHLIRNIDILKSVTIIKSAPPNTGHTIRYINTFQAGTSIESVFFNTGHTIRYINIFQAGTFIESFFFNTGHTIRNHNALQTSAAQKRVCINMNHTVRNCDVRNAPTLPECVVTYTGNTFFNYNLLDIITIFIPRSIFINVICHCARTGDGKHPLVIQFPDQVIAAGTGSNNARFVIFRSIGNPSNVTAVVLHHIGCPGGITGRIVNCSSYVAEVIHKCFIVHLFVALFKCGCISLEIDGTQIFTPGKHPCSERRNATRNHDACYAATARKCRNTNGGNTVRNHNLCQVLAIIERTLSNGGHALRNYDVCQCGTIIKSISANRSNSVGKIDA